MVKRFNIEQMIQTIEEYIVAMQELEKNNPYRYLSGFKIKKKNPHFILRTRNKDCITVL